MSLALGWLLESFVFRVCNAISNVLTPDRDLSYRPHISSSNAASRNYIHSAMEAPGTASGWKQTFEILTKYHDDVYSLYDEAVSLEKRKDFHTALIKYSHCLSVMEQALSLPLVSPPNPNLSWERAEIIVQKLQKSKEEIKGRVSSIQGNGNSSTGAVTSSPSAVPVTSPTSPTNPPTSPPSYEEAMGLSNTPENSKGAVKKDPTFVAGASPALRTYRELGEALNSLRQAYRTIVRKSTSQNGRIRIQVDEATGNAEVIFAYDNVRLYFISPDGTVASSLEPEKMIIVHFSEESSEEEDIAQNRPPAYLQVGTWIYPLVPGVSPCFRTTSRAFILPDIHSDVEGSAVGIILPDDADESVYELLEFILDGITLQLEPELAVGRARREVDFAHSVVRGARWVSSRLISGAERAGDLMNRSTPKILQHIEKEQPKEFSPNVAKGFEVAKNVSGKAVQVTGFIAGKVGLATSALGRFLAPHIQKQGTRLLTNTFKMDETEAKNKMDNVLEVTAGAVEAFGTVYGALDQSAHILAGSLATNTVSLVKHKYGAQAGQVAGNTFDTVGNVYVASHAIKRLNPKYVAKTAVKEAGKAVIEDQRKHLREDPVNHSSTATGSLSGPSD